MAADACAPLSRSAYSPLIRALRRRLAGMAFIPACSAVLHLRYASSIGA
ncbi:hypothetical protein [Streptomyces sp. UG1]